MSKINFISCVYWVKRGVSKEIPNKIELTKEDLKRIIDEQRQKLGTDENEEQMSVSSDEGNENTENRDLIQRYDLDNYDDDSEGELGTANLNSLAALTVYASEADDPFLETEENNLDETEENEDFIIKPTDNLLVVGHVENDASTLEIQVYSEEKDQYVHHDIILPAYPICFEWIDFNAQSEGPVNHIAIGDMTNEISIWDMDTVNCLEPVNKLVEHKDAVLDLSWNSILRKVLASGSADQTCFIWDLEKSQVLSRFNHFKSNVQSIKFHPFEAQTLLVGDNSGKISIVDCQSSAFKTFKVCDSEIEKVIWNQYNPYFFFCSTSDGNVYCYDVRSTQKHIYSIRAHNDSVTGLSLSSQCNGCLITASTDKVVKVWDVDESRAQFVAEFSDLNIGAVLSLSPNPDLPFIVAVGGDNNKTENIKVLDILKSKQVRSHFDSRINKSDKNNKNSD